MNVPADQDKKSDVGGQEVLGALRRRIRNLD